MRECLWVVGFMEVDLVVDCVVEGLDVDRIYRFTLLTRNLEGYSNESPPSNTIRPCEPLPAGWVEVFDKEAGKFYFFNHKTRQSIWERPETTLFFIPTPLSLQFSPIGSPH